MADIAGKKIQTHFYEKKYILIQISLKFVPVDSSREMF